jgi:hypothetical protein
MIKIKNFLSKKSDKAVPNQFIIEEEGRGANGNFIRKDTFQSYSSIIAIRTVWNDRTDIVLDKNDWNYSKTTSKYRNEFLGENTKTTKEKIKNGTYTLDNLNK